MQEMTAKEFYSYSQTNYRFRIIDVREPFEFDNYHITNSINIPLDLVCDKPYLFLNKHTLYFIVCRDGKRSIKASKALEEMDYQVVNVVDGIEKWPGKTARSSYY
jgi:rhodanese-related sulfurtransferase